MVLNTNFYNQHYRIFSRQNVQSKFRYMCPELVNPQEQEALLLNKGTGGLYFESQEYLRPGIQLDIFIEEPIAAEESVFKMQKLYLAIVRWCRELQTPAYGIYGVGAQFLNNECQWCGEIVPYEQIDYTETKVLLCNRCLQSLEALNSGRLKLSLTNHLLGNVV